MKCKWLALMLCLSCAIANADRVMDTPKQYLIPRPTRPVKIDGKLDEWDMDKSVYIINAKGGVMNPVHSNDPNNPVKGEADLSGRAALAWDEKHLYVAGRMVDDHLRGVKPDSLGNQGPPGWSCDSLMLAIASFRQPMKTNSPYSPRPFLGLRYAPSGPGARGKLVGNERSLNKRDLYWILTRNSTWAVTETQDGYQVEAAIPWADLEFTARPGERLFLSFLAADVDPGEALNQVGWGFTGVPKEEPLHRLSDGRDLMGMLSSSADEVPVDRQWAVRATLDVFKGAARLERIRVLDADNREVASTPIGLDIPAGKTGEAVRSFQPGALKKPGPHTIEAIAEMNGKTVVAARLPLKVVEPTPEPPLITNLPGEIHHMPPDRVAHHALDAHRRGWIKHGFVNGSKDYVPYIRRHVEPGLKGRCRQVIKTKSRHGYHEIFHCMALHRLTEDDEYIQLARQVVDYTLDSDDLGWFQLTAVAMYRYMTWMRDPQSPWAPKDAEKRYRAFMHRIAANPPKHLFTEWGTHNRVWHRYEMLKIARLVAEADDKPIDPRVIEYTNYHDKLIEQWGDADDASAGYHWVFLDAALGIYFHTGDWDAFLKNRGYVKTLSRYVEMVGPSGAVPQFASCSGWHEVGASMWAYELASKLTRDGRFRWTSHRIAEYYYNHLDHNGNQYHLPYDTARRNFSKAFLLADDSVTPQPPPGKSRLTWRHPLVKIPLEKRKARPGLARHWMIPSRWIPDKIVLSSGNDARSLWGLVELLPKAGHGGELPGNIITLMQHDSALLIGQGYYENTPDFQNIMWVEDLEGLAADPRRVTTNLPLWADDPAVSFARVHTTAYQHLPILYTRDIVFVKDAFMIVKDRVEFESTMKARLGPCWQTRSLGPQCGDHWFNAYYNQLYYTGLGLGRGVQAIRNPAWDVLIYFTPRQGRKHTVLDRYMENFYRCSPVQLRQVWSGMAEAGQTVTFTSVLLPHRPMLEPSQLLTPPEDSDKPKRIETVRDDDDVTVLKIVVALDTRGRRHQEIWVMLNETGQPLEDGPLRSDARLAVIKLDDKGAVRERVMVGGRMLWFRGNDETLKARRHKDAPLKKPEELVDWEEEFAR